MDKREIAAMGVCAIVVAAGASRRMQGTDKILAALGDRPVLAWSVQALENCVRVDRIILVISPTNIEPVRRLVAAQKWSKVTGICPGGQRRQDSVAAGLQLAGPCEWVIIHDGARPFLSRELIENGLDAARTSGAAVAAVPVTDTIKIADGNQMVIETPDRHYLWAVQTPQVFRSEMLKAAYAHNPGDVTDDASLVEMAGGTVRLYAGSPANIKITTPHDLAVAELWRKEYDG